MILTPYYNFRISKKKVSQIKYIVCLYTIDYWKNVNGKMRFWNLYYWKHSYIISRDSALFQCNLIIACFILAIISGMTELDNLY